MKQNVFSASALFGTSPLSVFLFGFVSELISETEICSSFFRNQIKVRILFELYRLLSVCEYVFTHFHKFWANFRIQFIILSPYCWLWSERTNSSNN